MAKVNWKADQAPIWPAGIYLAEITQAEEKKSSKGDQMFNVSFVALDFGRRKLCEDFIMLEGKGAGMGVGKMKLLGMVPDKAEVLAGELVGKRAYINIVLDVYETSEGKRYEKMAIQRTDDAKLGYWEEGRAPAGVLIPTADEAGSVDNASDVPF